MAKTPATVDALLEQIHKMAKPVAAREFATVLKEKQKSEPAATRASLILCYFTLSFDVIMAI